MDELVDKIKQAASAVGDTHFLELLRWHRAVTGLPDLDWSRNGAYRVAITELGPQRAAELLGDLCRAARDSRRHRHGADGKPRYRAGRTLRNAHKGQ